MAYNIDNKAIHSIEKQMPKLNDGHIVKKKVRKMRVKPAPRALKEFSPGHVNEDAVEIFFGMIRSYNRRNVNPTCMQFESFFKALLINNLTSAKTER